MQKETVIEAATYIIVPSMMWVVSPLLGKWLDSFYFHYPNMFAVSPAILIPGVLISAGGMVLALWTIYLFKTIGQGTPNPSLPPKVFVVSGPYKFSRNPMALGGLLVLIGESVFYYSPSLLGIALLYGVIIHLYIVFVEEPVLIKRFGEPYLDYLKRVPRFFPNPWKRFQ